MSEERQDKTAIFRMDAEVYERVKGHAVELGLNVSAYLRVMACWPWPYTLVEADVNKILERMEQHPEEERPEEALLLLRSALMRLETGRAEIDAFLEKIQPEGLTVSQRTDRYLLGTLEVDLREKLAEYGAWRGALTTVWKRYEERRSRHERDEGTPT
jgi:hypothetical protein